MTYKTIIIIIKSYIKFSLLIDNKTGRQRVHSPPSSWTVERAVQDYDSMLVSIHESCIWPHYISSTCDRRECLILYTPVEQLLY